MAKYKTKEDVIKSIRKQVEKDLRLPCPSKNKALREAAIKYYGSWEAGIKAAGFSCKDAQQRVLSDIDRALLNADWMPLKKSVESQIPAKCKNCYWRDGAFCPFIECVKYRKGTKQ